MNKLIAAIAPFIIFLTAYSQNDGEYDRGFKQFNWLSSVDSVLAKADLYISSIVYSGTQSLSAFKKDSSKILFREKFQSNLFDVDDCFKRKNNSYRYEPDFFENIKVLNESTPILILELSNLEEKRGTISMSSMIRSKAGIVEKISEAENQRIEDSIKQVNDNKFTYQLYFINDQLFMVQAAFPISSFDLNSIEKKFNTSHKRFKDTVNLISYPYGISQMLVANRQIEWQNKKTKIIMTYRNEVDQREKMIEGRPIGEHWRICYIYKDFLANIKLLNANYLDSLQYYCSQVEIYRYFSEPQNGIGNLNWGSNQISLLTKQFDNIYFVYNSRFLNENNLTQANVVYEKATDGRIISLKKGSHSIDVLSNSMRDYQKDPLEFDDGNIEVKGELYYELDLLLSGEFNVHILEKLTRTGELIKDYHLEYIFYKSLIRDYIKRLGKPSRKRFETRNDIEEYCKSYLWENNDLKVELNWGQYMNYKDGITIEIHSKIAAQQIKEIRKADDEKEKNKRLEQNKSLDNKY